MAGLPHLDHQACQPSWIRYRLLPVPCVCGGDLMAQPLILQMRKPRSRDGEGLAQGHMMSMVYNHPHVVFGLPRWH